MSNEHEQYRLDREMQDLIDRNGLPDVLAALCRRANDLGMAPVFKKLNAVYEWLTKSP